MADQVDLHVTRVFSSSSAQVRMGIRDFSSDPGLVCERPLIRAGDSPNRDIDADAEINLASHEQMDIATDPEATGWFGPGCIFDEIGDKCSGVFGPLNAKGTDVVFQGHAYIVQEEWDNTVSGCALGCGGSVGCDTSA